MFGQDEILTIREVADYLKVNERTVYKLAQENAIPAVKVANQWRFRKSMLDAWLDLRMTSHCSPGKRVDLPTVANASALFLTNILRPEAIRLSLRGNTRESVLQELVTLLVENFRVKESADLYPAILAREQLCSTAIVEGVAIPHPRYNGSRFVEEPAIVVGRSAQGVDFGSLDGDPTRLFFLMCAPSDNVHLLLIARLSRILNDPDLRTALLEARAAEAVIEIIGVKEKPNARDNNRPARSRERRPSSPPC